jgi:hypothetical protein
LHVVRSLFGDPAAIDFQGSSGNWDNASEAANTTAPITSSTQPTRLSPILASTLLRND